MIKFKLYLIPLITMLILSGCVLSDGEIIILADDIAIERGTTLDGTEVINLAIADVELPNALYSSYSSKLKGFEAIEWETVGSYKLTYEVCIDDKTCNSEDFELNIVNSTTDTSEAAIQDIRKVYINATGIDVPLNQEISASEIIDRAVVKVIDSSDGSFKQSLSIEDFSSIDWNTVGEYQVSIGGCDRQLNCDETDIVIHVRDDIDQIQTHYTDE